MLSTLLVADIVYNTLSDTWAGVGGEKRFVLAKSGIGLVRFLKSDDPRAPEPR